MTDSRNVRVGSRQLAHFRQVQWLTNHWGRPRTPASYYWYLTFERSSELHALAIRCQAGLTLPYYDMTPPDELHMTLDRVAFQRDVNDATLDALRRAAEVACAELQPFVATIGGLAGTSGAVGFSASPLEHFHRLRDALRGASLRAYPDARISNGEFDPHVAIGYCNSRAPSAPVIAVVETLHSLPTVDVMIQEAVLVQLRRLDRGYSWQPVARIPLSADHQPDRLPSDQH